MSYFGYRLIVNLIVIFHLNQHRRTTNADLRNVYYFCGFVENSMVHLFFGGTNGLQFLFISDIQNSEPMRRVKVCFVYFSGNAFAE